MQPTRERRNDHPERVPLRLAVELGHGDFRDPFAADALNVSKGGISMRAPCLPDIGSRLVCRFRCMPSNTLVTVQGEIVWAHLDGEQVGEFGLAFVDLDAKTEWLIEEMIAEHAAWSHDSEAAAPIARLELEGSPEPIEARLSHQGDGRAVFEQELDLLSLGRAVRAHAPGLALLPGSIAAVELRMVGAVPMLTVTVAFEREPEKPAAVEVDLADMPLFARIDREAAAVHDTEPDLIAPTVESAGARDVQAVLPAVAQVAPSQVAPPQVSITQASAVQAKPVEREPVEKAPVAARVQKQEDSAFQRDFSRDFKLEIGADDDAELEADLAAVRPDLWGPLLRACARHGRTLLAALVPLLRSLSATTSKKALPVVRGAALQAGSGVRAFYRAQLAPQLGATRRVLAAQLSSRRRRVTAGPGSEKQAGVAPLARTILLGSIAAGALGLAVYAFAPSAGDDAVAVHRKLRHRQAPPPAEAPERSEAAAPASAPAAAAEPAAVTVEAKSASAAQPSAAATKSAAVTTGGSAAAASSEEKPAAGRKLHFGAARVPGGRQFALRMSAKVQSIQGSAERDGFTVIINGALSLDRAGPISSGHKSVSRAMVINKGDHAELNVRFSDGKQPAYQVSADGSTLYITIQDA